MHKFSAILAAPAVALQRSTDAPNTITNDVPTSANRLETSAQSAAQLAYDGAKMMAASAHNVLRNSLKNAGQYFTDDDPNEFEQWFINRREQAEEYFQEIGAWASNVTNNVEHEVNISYADASAR